MLKSKFQISIITLTKDDNLKFLRTLRSIKKQEKTFNLEWIIIDGSSKKKYVKNKNDVKKNLNKEDKIYIKHINSKELNINGIYPCMNYGKKVSKGKYIIFLNSGDKFYDKGSLRLFFNYSLNIDNQFGLIFGQAKIIANNKLKWFFPGKKLKNINKWLKYFEPNHQTMLISRKLANRFDFTIESVGIITPSEIFRRACKKLVHKINHFNRNLDLALDSKESDIEIRESSGVMSGFDITIKNENHTLGFLLQTYINKLNQGVFVGYMNPHPLQKEIKIRVNFNDDDINTVKTVFEKTTSYLIGEFTKLSTEKF